MRGPRSAQEPDRAVRGASHRAEQWNESFIRDQLDFARFRDHSIYVRQGAPEWQYRLSWRYIDEHDHLDLRHTLVDDDAFGATAWEIEGRLMTRDLIDSILELNFLEQALPGVASSGPSIIDIGAGYGRFAHRCRAAFTGSRLTLCDAVPISALLAEFYLAYRQVDGVTVVDLDEVELLRADCRFDLAVSMHTFNEMPVSAISWWLQLLAALDVPYLFFVPNNVQGTRSRERDGRQLPFDRLLVDNGYALVHARDKYWEDPVAQRDGLYPGTHLLYARM